MRFRIETAYGYGVKWFQIPPKDVWQFCKWTWTMRLYHEPTSLRMIKKTIGKDGGSLI